MLERERMAVVCRLLTCAHGQCSASLWRKCSPEESEVARPELEGLVAAAAPTQPTLIAGAPAMRKLRPIHGNIHGTRCGMMWACSQLQMASWGSWADTAAHLWRECAKHPSISAEDTMAA